MSLIEVSDLRVVLEGSGRAIVESISFQVEAGEVLAVVGESGSGKSTIGAALLGYARRGARIASGSVTVAGRHVVPTSSRALREVRGKVIGYIPQDPAAALNPAMRIGTLIEETLAAHRIGDTKAARSERVRQVLREVRLPDDNEFIARFPHQLSGGQQQRVCIAIAISCRPQVIVMDEPTTGLDVTTQAHVLRTLADLVAQHGLAAIYITHDLAVVANIADRVLVLYSGRVAESGDHRTVLERSAHPYTRALLGAAPDISDQHVLTVIPGRAPSLAERPETGCSFAPRCRYVMPDCSNGVPELNEISSKHLVACIRARELPGGREPREIRQSQPRSAGQAILEVTGLGVSFGTRQVLSSVSFQLLRGECLALVGESGSGKTTLSRSIVGLIPNRAGQVTFRGSVLPSAIKDYSPEVKRKLQYIFQSPYNSLNPRRPIGSALATPVKQFYDETRRDIDGRIDEALDRVSLSSRVKVLYPDQLSGGERQRVAIARALVCQPEVLLCDEITSALDVSVQAAIVQLLEDLRQSERLSILFITHNLALVRSIADRVIVLNEGVVAETGITATVLTHPTDEYTRSLVRDTPGLYRDVSVNAPA